MRRIALFMILAIAGSTGANGASEQILTEQEMVPSPQPGMMIYVRAKHREDVTSFNADHTLVFVHGATYPASTTFDLAVGGQSWMDFIAQRGFYVYSIDLPGYGYSTRQRELDQPPEANEPVENTADAIADYNAVVDWVCSRRHLERVDVVGWSWGTTIAGGFAAQHPDKVNKLVLYAAIWLSRNKPPTDRLPAYRTVTPDAALSRWLTGVPEDKKTNRRP